MHVVGKKCIRHYAADRVLMSFRDAGELLCLRLHKNTSWRVETQSSTGILMNQNASGSGYSGTRHDWAPTEHATIIFSKNCPYITAVKVVVGVQLSQDCSWPRKKDPDNPHMTARDKFRPSVNSICCIVSNTFLGNHMPFHASTILYYTSLHNLWRAIGCT